MPRDETGPGAAWGIDGAGAPVPGSPVRGVAYAAAAYVIWGTFPLYFRALDGIPAPEILAHRIAWSAAFLVVLVTAWRRWPDVTRQLRAPGTLLRLSTSAVLISGNWLIYIWAVNAEHVLDASLGYFVNPLVSVLLGVAFLHEPLSRRQVVAVALAAAGVLTLVVRAGVFPWVALSLAVSFGLYGLVRKRTPVDATAGLLGEVAVLAPVALVYLGLVARRGEGHLGDGALRTALLVLLGVVTAVPLIWFAVGVRRLRLATIGVLQYVNPTMQFAVAVFVFGEPFTAAHRIAFGCIWAALAIYTSEALGVARTPPPR
ncbi:MAG TPA: EamA family transporter RarD [Anaeromyxobacter sp.]|nr:EamA family transporter RarD [Anaeromyxobacter sp.]